MLTEVLTLTLPESRPLITAGDKEVLLVTNADLRETANVACWPVQNKFEDKLEKAVASRFGYKVKRAHLYKGDKGHGFISSQREGSDLFASIIDSRSLCPRDELYRAEGENFSPRPVGAPIRLVFRLALKLQ